MVFFTGFGRDNRAQVTLSPVRNGINTIHVATPNHKPILKILNGSAERRTTQVHLVRKHSPNNPIPSWSWLRSPCWLGFFCVGRGRCACCRRRAVYSTRGTWRNWRDLDSWRRLHGRALCERCRNFGYHVRNLWSNRRHRDGGGSGR